MSFAAGSLVRARGREWVVLPESEDDLLVMRPLGGTDEEIAGIYLPLEPVESASFAPPDPTRIGDHRSCRLLRDAVRLGFRSSAGPFRSFARLGIEPRPYQLVPLLMALKLDPVRLLIADDVGIGKTIEAGLIARELLDRGEIRRLTVLCPPQLAEQWQSELDSKFHIEAELVLPGTATRLERRCRVGESLFDIYPFVVVSTDFIKSDRRRDDFLRACPECVIVDEAHTCAWSGEGRSGRHQRHRLVSGLAAPEKGRHLILVTATPHSGNEGAFRSLLGLLNPEFLDLPDDLTGKENEPTRRRLATQLVQRRRGDIRYFLKSDTPFPAREEAEESYKLNSDYRRLFARVVEYARETVTESGEARHRQRVQWWSALALLRALASSPAAAAATLRTRAATLDTQTTEEADAVGRRTVLDLLDEGGADANDVTPGGDTQIEEGEHGSHRRRLLEMARQAEALFGDKKDEKLRKAASLVAALIKDGYQPIVFCRFIATAEYIAEQLRQVLPKDIDIAAVTSELPPAEREARVNQLAKSPKHVLVATDCLSEGINLQRDFDAVLHYDLSWNPTRHEQREGRVDRYGQPSSKVRVITYYGLDNQIDGVVLDVLIRKHKKIRSSLGISVPVPVDTEQVVEAVFEGLLLRTNPGNPEQLLLDFEDYFRPRKEDLFAKWDLSAEREKRSRTMFSQEGLSTSVAEVERELAEVREAIGSSVDVAAFTKEALKVHGAVVNPNGVVKVDLAEVPGGLRDVLTPDRNLLLRFEPPTKAGELLLTRTHPLVEGLAGYILDTALDEKSPSIARRCGVIRTRRVSRRTTLLLLRLRYHIVTRSGETERALLAEDSLPAAFAGAPTNPEWLTREAAEDLLQATPDANINPDQATDFVRKVNQEFPTLGPYLRGLAEQRGEELLEAHTRVRAAARVQGVRYRVETQPSPDVLGVFVYLPVVQGN